MARRELSVIQSGLDSWEATTNDDFNALGADGKPMTVPESADVASLPAANQHDRSVITVNDAAIGYRLCHDDGSDYQMLVPSSTIVVGATKAGAQTDLQDALRVGGSSFFFDDVGIVFPVKTWCLGHSTQFRHNHGSDPGDWTLSIENSDTPAENETSAIALNASSAVWQKTTELLADPVVYAAGEEMILDLTGPSTTDPDAVVTLFLIHELNPSD